MKNLLLFISLFFSIFALNAAIIEKTYYSDDVKIIQSGEYQLISFENAFLTGKTGEPVLPYFSVSLILPPGEIAKSIEFTGEEETQLPGSYQIFPQQQSRPLSEPGQGIFIINEKVYKTDASYPTKQTGEYITEFMNGYAIALSSFTPVKYNPVTGKVSFYKKVKIRITTAPSPVAVQALQNLSTTENIKKRVLGFAQNPSLISQYPQDNKNDDYQLLIITPSQFENNFQDLIDIYFERGIKTEVVTKEFISSNGTGQDLQDKIRNYIIQEYQDHSVEYVLLGGDSEHIPYRGFYCYVQSGSGYEDNNIPADLYYSGLDGTWNDDNDNSWGEPGEDDLLPDIAVARFSFSNTSELSNMINKSVSYQNNPVLGEFQNPLLAGEYLYSNPETWGSDYLELLIGFHDDNGYTTIGIPENFNIETLYEKDQSWSGSDLMAEINQGKQFVHHCGHAGETSVAHLYISDITNSNFSGANGTDHNYTLLQTHGCNCGDFTYSDCILEKMVSIQNFAVAVIGNSRYGWFNEGQTEGPAAHLHREMVDALYNEKLNHIGAAFVECKIQTAPWVTAPGQWEEGALRWNFYDINILGDPVLSVWTDEPVSIEASYQNAITIGVPSTSVTVTSSGSPMENFSCAIIKDGVLHGVGYTDASGTAQITFDPAFTTVGDAQLIISGYNCLPTSYPITIIPNSGSYVIYSSHLIDDSQGNNNNEVDFGEAIDLTVEVENVGTQQANNVQVTLTSPDSYITITDGFENYGNIAGGSTFSVSNAFAFEVASNIPDQHLVTFQLEIVGEDTWISNFNILVNAPVLTIGNLTIDDSQGGNGDGILDPGEAADIIIESSNFGHCACENVNGILTSTSSYISITGGTYSLGTLGIGETKQAVFSIIVDQATPIGTSIDLNFELISGEYSAQNTFYVTVGLVYEDFETGDFSAFNWEFGGNAPWIVTTENPYEGVYCAKSGDIGDQQSSELFITMDVLTDDNISFFRKVSSEEGWDYLRFYIDGTKMNEWSGEEGWEEFSYPVSAGAHTFKWVYEKDWSQSNGSDCGWIDYIIFPAACGGNTLSVSASANPAEICYGESSQLNAYASGGTGNYSYEWSPTTGLSDPNIQNPVASPLETTNYTVTVNDGNSNITDDVTVTIHPVPETPVINQQDDHLYSSAADGNQWYDSNGPITGATSQTYYPTATDYYYVIVTNEFGCSSNQSNMIYFIYTSIEENLKNSFNIYPNPFVDHFTVEYELQEESAVTITLFDKLGKEIEASSYSKQSPGFYQLDFTKPELQPGIYFIRIETGTINITRKLVLSK